VVPSSTGSSSLGRLFLTFVTSVNIYQSTRCNLPEVSNFRIYTHRLSVYLMNIATVFVVSHLCTREYGYPLICGWAYDGRFQPTVWLCNQHLLTQIIKLSIWSSRVIQEQIATASGNMRSLVWSIHWHFLGVRSGAVDWGRSWVWFPMKQLEF
jgi:hypothetical protein